MSIVHQIEANKRIYTVVGDLTKVSRALVVGRVEDELTGEPPQGSVTVRTTKAGVSVKVLRDGMFCLAGQAARVFPQLATTGGELDLVITAAGYRGWSEVIAIPQNANLPVSLLPVQLRRVPVRLQGRVVKDTSGRPPIPGAKVLAVGGPSAFEHAVALRSPLYFAHAKGADVQECQFTPSGSPLQLVSAAPAKSRTLTLSRRTGLAVNDVLRFGAEIGVEYASVESLDALPADLNLPGRVTLRNALHRSYAVNAEVQKVTTSMVGAVLHLAQPADAGDGLALLDAPTNAEALAIESAAAPVAEYHALGALTDEDGYYHLNGIARVGVVELEASALGFAPMPNPVAWTLNYKQPVNIVNFRLS